jgi:hypothetical protein
MITLEYIRSFRIAGYALFDLAVSYIGIYFLAPLLTRFFLLFKIRISRKSWLILTLPLSIIVHLAVGNYTQMTKDFFDMYGHYGIKILNLIMLVVGFREVKLSKNRP